MTDDSWFASTMDLVGLHLHVLGAADHIGRMEKLHYFISFLPLAQFYMVMWYQIQNRIGVHGFNIFLLHEYGHDASIR